MKQLPFAILALSLAGCAHNFTVIPTTNGQPGKGVAQEAGKKITLELNGKTYEGTYVIDTGKVVQTYSSGSARAYSGPHSATAYGSGQSSTYIPGSGNGRFIATSPDGDVLRCEFIWKSGSGLGSCTDNKGLSYDLIIHN